jgi:hypothetical protein
MIRVERNVRYVAKQWRVGPPKTDVGQRTVALPALVATSLSDHLERFVADEPDALAFGTASGRYLARQNFTATFSRAVPVSPPTRATPCSERLSPTLATASAPRTCEMR